MDLVPKVYYSLIDVIHSILAWELYWYLRVPRDASFLLKLYRSSTSSFVHAKKPDDHYPGYIMVQEVLLVRNKRASY